MAVYPISLRQLVGALLAAIAIAMAVPAIASADGELTQKAGTAGCATFDGSETCATVPQVGRMAVVSPDGKHLYTEAWEPRAAIQIFDRDPATGALTAKPGVEGCWQNTGAGGTCQVLGLTKPSGIAISPDGKNLYVSDFHTGTILTFDIAAGTGLLTKKPGIEGCMVANGNGVSCANSPASSLPFHLVVSPDGKNLYGQSQQGGGAITTYKRDPNTGVLTVPIPSDGVCVSNDGSEGGGFPSTTCIDGRGLFVPEAIGISADGKNIYVGSRERAVTVFDRDPVTGLLTQKAGVAGCWLATSAPAQTDCQSGTFIDGGGGRFGLDVAPDGKGVYVATNDSLAVFIRNTSNGELSQPAGEGGCVSSLGPPCFPAGPNMASPQDASVSPDGLQVYVATAANNNTGVAIFDRDPATGVLTQKLGKDGCHNKSGTGCTAARALPASTILTSPDGKNVYANSGGGAIAIFDRELPPAPDPGPGPGGGGGGGSGGGASTGGIGTQTSTPAKPGPTISKNPQVGVQLVGRPQAGHYPYTASLLLTNYGGKDAINASVRIDGFHTGANVTLLGSGATGTVLDDGGSRSLLITVERIPARSSKVVLARFVPVGPGHSFYNLHASLMRNSSKGGVPKLTETRSVVTRTVTSSKGDTESGQVSITNTAGTATIPYKLTETSAPERAQTKFDEVGGGLRVTVTAPQHATAIKPPTGSETKLKGGVRLELSIDAAGLKVLGVDNPVWPMAGGIKLHYDELIDCMQRHGMLTAADQKRLKAMYTQQVLALIHTGRLLQSSSAPPTPEAEEWAERTISIAASAVQSWEAEIVDSAKLDNAGGGKDKQKQIFIECSREERKEEGKKEEKEESGGGEWEDDESDLPVEVITPDDPNTKIGPSGAGKAGYILSNRLMPYTIMFENKPTASAPAREVVVTDRIDGSKLDLATFALGPVWFGDKVLTPPPGLRAWSGSIDLRPAKPVIVTVDAAIDGSGLATWHFKTIEPATGVFPEDPLAGFLPANKTPPIGEGAVTFSVAQKRNLKTGAKISNGARIVFDKNEAIDTPIFTNTIDRAKPKATLRKAKARKSGKACRVALAWKGADKGSGVGGYTVSVASSKTGKFRAVRYDYSRTKLTYKGKRGASYWFRVVPADKAGNVGKASKPLRASCPRG